MPWNDAEAIEGFMAEHGDEVAAILTEPIMGNTGVIPPNPGYLELLRDLTTTHGSVLIFDEVITGFRVALGGAQAKYGVTPDLTTMAKALGGGFPVSAVGGKARADGAGGRRRACCTPAPTTRARSRPPPSWPRSASCPSRAPTSGCTRCRSGCSRGSGILTDVGVAVQVQGVGPMFQTWFSETPVTTTARRPRT